MTEKRFTIHKENMYKEDWYDYPFCIKEDGEVVLETIPLFIAEKVRDKLNEQDRKIRQLHSDYKYLREVNKATVKQCERWKNLYELKDAEVTARVKRLNEICNRYKYAITFDKDIDPNDAVNILCDRILQTEVEMMSDCDNCIYLDQDTNGEYCHKGHTGHKTLIHNCCDFEHWNTLTDEEKKQCNEKRLENDKRNL